MSPPRLPLAILGCGRVVERLHLPAIRRSPEVSVVGAVEPDPARRAWAERALGGVPVVASFPELLARARPQAVLIATPPVTHARLALAALKAGCHVLVEKPLATTAADARAVVAAAQGRVLAVGFNRRFRRPYARSRAMIREKPAAPLALRARLVTDSGRWPGAEVAPAGRHRAMLEDVVPHLVDLVPWLASQAIAAVRAEPSAAAKPGITFTLRLVNGTEAPCVAGHGTRYEEGLVLRLGGRAWLAHPWGLAPANGLGRVIERTQAGLGLLLPKVLGRPSLTAASIAAQLGAFARACKGERAGELADGEAGLAAALALDALLASEAQGGSWVELHGMARA